MVGANPRTTAAMACWFIKRFLAGDRALLSSSRLSIARSPCHPSRRSSHRLETPLASGPQKPAWVQRVPVAPMDLSHRVLPMLAANSFVAAGRDICRLEPALDLAEHAIHQAL